MESNWAADHLQVIRTLMERTAIYRRALAPITLTIGILGLCAAPVGWACKLDSSRAFIVYWLSVSVMGLILSFLLARRQALVDKEAFWSPPTRRVAEALLPSLLAGVIVSLLSLLPRWQDPVHTWWLPPAWMMLYGCAAHAAGFFMRRGMRLLGWLFILSGCGLALGLSTQEGVPPLNLAHWVMGGSFGGLHLAYGLYLYATEPGKNAA